MTRVLVTAFEPFGGSAVNASQEAVSLLPTEIEGAEIVTAVLPCVFGTSARAIVDLVEQTRPDVVVAVGEAGGRGSVDLERVAVNLDDARIPDNAGNRPIDVPVVDGGPAGYFSTLPVKAAAAAIDRSGAPGGVSGTAGSFVCNHVFYALMHHLAELSGVRGGFVHVPVVDRLAPAMAARAIASVVSASLSTEVDLRVSRGTEY